MGHLMKKHETVKEPVKRIPVAEYEIPAGIRDSNLGLDSNRNINAWALDRTLAFLGAHSVDIVDSLALSNDGKCVELVRDGDMLQLFDML